MRHDTMDPEIDRLFDQAGMASQRPVNPVVLQQIVGTVTHSLRPVRPRPTAWMQVAGLLLGSAAVAAMEAAAAGFEGLWALTLWHRVVILTTLTMLGAGLARQMVALWTPGSRLLLNPHCVVAASWVSMVLLFELVFHDARSRNLVSLGIGCLQQGLLHALPAAALLPALMHRGFATRPTSAALSVGALAGLVGAAFLEMHCTNVEAAHRAVCHAAVVPLCAMLTAAGVWAATGADALSRRAWRPRW